jgi:hypothetical protein
MNRQLETTETAFGRAVQALNFRRRILSAKLLWRPLPEGWETGAPILRRSSTKLAIPDAVLQHRAVLTLPDGTPFSEVVETYTAEILAFPPPLGHSFRLEKEPSRSDLDPKRFTAKRVRR